MIKTTFPSIQIASSLPLPTYLQCSVCRSIAWSGVCVNLEGALACARCCITQRLPFRGVSQETFRELDCIDVHCPFIHRGCTYQGPATTLVDHLSGCPCLPVPTRQLLASWRLQNPLPQQQHDGFAGLDQEDLTQAPSPTYSPEVGIRQFDNMHHTPGAASSEPSPFDDCLNPTSSTTPEAQLLNPHFSQEAGEPADADSVSSRQPSPMPQQTFSVPQQPSPMPQQTFSMPQPEAFTYSRPNVFRRVVPKATTKPKPKHKHKHKSKPKLSASDESGTRVRWTSRRIRKLMAVAMDESLIGVGSKRQSCHGYHMPTTEQRKALVSRLKRTDEFAGLNLTCNSVHMLFKNHRMTAWYRKGARQGRWLYTEQEFQSRVEGMNTSHLMVLASARVLDELYSKGISCFGLARYYHILEVMHSDELEERMVRSNGPTLLRYLMAHGFVNINSRHSCG